VRKRPPIEQSLCFNLPSRVALQGAAFVRVAELKQQLGTIVGHMQALERRAPGPKSEKMPSPAAELRCQQSDDDAEARRLSEHQRRLLMSVMITPSCTRRGLPVWRSSRSWCSRMTR
jgi:hypothetical protein